MTRRRFLRVLSAVVAALSVPFGLVKIPRRFHQDSHQFGDLLDPRFERIFADELNSDFNLMYERLTDKNHWYLTGDDP